MTRLQTLDLPSFYRASVGFNKLFDDIERQFANSSTTSSNYPPYNVVEINNDEWIISVAVAGFRMDNLDITLEKNILTIEGTSAKGDDSLNYLYKGIGSRNFRRQFTIAEHVEVDGATLELGILNIHLKRNIPEAYQPKKIAIKTTEKDLIEG